MLIIRSDIKIYVFSNVMDLNAFLDVIECDSFEIERNIQFHGENLINFL